MVSAPVLLAAMVAGLAALRLFELVVARRHLAALVAKGGVLPENDAYAPIVAVHVAFFVGLVAEGLVFEGARFGWWTVPGFAVFAAGLALRYWAISTLGPRWTTRVVVVPGETLVAAGPYRRFRHPNYLGVALELAGLPLAFGLWNTALLVGLANLIAIKRRVEVEESALSLADRRGHKI
jgi:methyltransferase